MDRFAVHLVTYGVAGSLALLVLALVAFGLDSPFAWLGPDAGFAFLAISVVLLVLLLGCVVVGTTVLSRPFFLAGGLGTVRHRPVFFVGLTYTVLFLVAVYFGLR